MVVALLLAFGSAPHAAGAESSDRPDILFIASDQATAASVTSYHNFHGLRTDHFRYIWYPNELEELYDHRVDPNEFENLAYDPQHRNILDKHREMMRSQTGVEITDGDPIVVPGFELLPNQRLRRTEFTPMSELVKRARAEQEAPE